jgi:uncharacterized membrane protein YadS
MIGQVKIASMKLGERCLEIAMGYKLLRVATLTVAAAAAYFVFGRGSGRRRFPWFMVIFILLAVAVNIVGVPGGVREALGLVSRFSLTAALGAIGLSMDFDAVTEKGPDPMYAAALTVGIIVLSVYLALTLVH